jgi:hypothetical protein
VLAGFEISQREKRFVALESACARPEPRTAASVAAL